ncbi:MULTISPECIES: aminoglycoside phosphotransferase family protein [unclassified Microbacterium]|uniref:aminoglycoside phosphotransferase family protein n=1 Tax=unclassified Microbacterium TaxID=2609290 RepID=UPI000DE4A681|nr:MULTISPECIES: aminoglycoside phosphotransferase family protein [unclassified Microbacterium]NYF30267.1 streptomycin 6-kinase [Microbacterium sp. JAI119]RBO73335.1 hydroxyurea phosphotransferase [Microbacterium sp. H6]
MRPEQSSVIPVEVVRGFRSRDDTTREWAAQVSAVALDLQQRWELRPEGTVRSGEAGVFIPVRRADGTPAALKLQVPRAETTAAIIGLTRWQGAGIVRLLDSDADRGGMLLERLQGDRALETVEDDDAAVRVVGGLLARLHAVAAPDGLPRLATITAEMIADAAAAARVLDDDDRSRLDRWVDTVSAVADDTGDRLLHWDLHYGNVLAADREPWLAIDPEPLVGDPGFDLWPALDSGWSDDPAPTDAPRLVRRRFDILTEMLDLDRHRAAAWTRARLLQNTLWDIEDGQPAISAAAKLVDDALLAAHSSEMR